MKKYILLFFLAVAIITVSFVGYEIFGTVELKQENAAIEIKSGATVKEVSRALRDQGIIKNDFWFRVFVWLKGKEANFVAGRFVLPAKINAKDLLNLLTSGQARPVRKVTIIEGCGIRDIAAYLEKEGWSKTEDLKKLEGHEGYLFPDTYYLFADATIDDLLKKMQENFDRRVGEDLHAEIKRQGKDFYEVLKVASIIEAEVPHEADRAAVSDIIWTRLKIGMPIQSDATLNYAIDGNNAALTAKELQIDSLYNTYKYKGLPPTPIGNPGISAIRAAIYPAKTDYLYFLSTPEGQTIFSRNLDEHNRAKAKYLR